MRPLRQKIDPDIYDIILKFNKMGMKTETCCAGIGNIEDSNKSHLWNHYPYISFDVRETDKKIVRAVAGWFLFDPTIISLPKTKGKETFWINPIDIGPKSFNVIWPEYFSLATIHCYKRKLHKGKCTYSFLKKYEGGTSRALEDIPSFFSLKDYDGLGIYFGDDIIHYLRFLYSLSGSNKNKIKNISIKLKQQWLNFIESKISI